MNAIIGSWNLYSSGVMVPEGYSSQHDYYALIEPEAEARRLQVEVALHDAFEEFVSLKQVEVVVFADIDAQRLAVALKDYPIILKSILTCCNVAPRSIERDLGIKNVDSFKPRITADEALLIAGYIKPFLPPIAELPSLGLIDKYCYIDKEIRKGKGNWELKIKKTINELIEPPLFKKDRFEVNGEFFELDLARRDETGVIVIGIDIKRIEARRDLHKRSDEIVNKADKFKKTHPRGFFAAMVYYPFFDEHANIQSRLSSDNINVVAFANDAEETISNAVWLIMAKYKEHQQ